MVTSGTGQQGQEVIKDTRQPPHTPIVYAICDLHPPPTQEEEKNLDRGENLDLGDYKEKVNFMLYVF